jgi:hypothetical protein
MPLAMLEDVLVPVYLYHRYQAEAVAKMVGGMDYNYAMRGDGQVVTKPLDRAVQQKALDALIATLQPAQLRLPDSLLKLLPPRPAGYDFTPELFSKHTGLAFDVLSPAEAAADMVLSLLLHPERISRMVQYEQTVNGLPLTSMLTSLVTQTFEAPRQKGMEALIQQQNEQLLLTYLMSITLNDQVNYAARAIVKKHLTDLKTGMIAKEKAATDPLWKGHYQLALQRMEKPELAKPTLHAQAPPGAPIGCE